MPIKTSTLIAATELLALQREGTPCVLLDCGFDLADTAAGERAHAHGHLPGAHYLHLERDMAGAKHDGQGRFRGRHPLPERDTFAALVGRLGITPGVVVVCYDAQGGPYAARAWWMLRWLGHDAVAVLDGGPAAWLAAGGPLSADAVTLPDGPAYPPRDATLATIDTAPLARSLGRVRLVDARSGERFRGEVEPLDAVAGHLPGARHRFFKDNLAADGRFQSAAQLHAEGVPLVAGHSADNVVQQCGSGVTACHNLLALAHAGLGLGVLYPGSWSEWSSDAARPVASGA